MRDQFWQHFPQSGATAESIWPRALISVDTNVLLHVYRGSDNLRDGILDALKGAGDKLVIAHQVGVEFFANRLSVISGQIDLCTKFQEYLRTMGSRVKKTAEDKTNRPHITPALASQLDITIASMLEEVGGQITYLRSLRLDDPVLERLGHLLSGRMTAAPTPEQTQAAILECRQRFASNIPPGYDDKNKSKNDAGDCLLWQSLVEHCRVKRSDLIFVTAERKPDWWLKLGNTVLSPLPALVREFREATDGNLVLIDTSALLRLASTHFSVTISKANLEEAERLDRQVSPGDEDAAELTAERWRAMKTDRAQDIEFLKVCAHDRDPDMRTEAIERLGRLPSQKEEIANFLIDECWWGFSEVASIIVAIRELGIASTKTLEFVSHFLGDDSLSPSAATTWEKLNGDCNVLASAIVGMVTSGDAELLHGVQYTLRAISKCRVAAADGLAAALLLSQPEAPAYERENLLRAIEQLGQLTDSVEEAVRKAASNPAEADLMLALLNR